MSVLSEARTATGAAAAERGRRFATLRLALRFALREMRGGLKGFAIFLACIMLGVAAIAAVNSVAAMMTGAIAGEGRAILGGDVRFNLVQRPASAEERAYLDSLGAVAETISMRSMVRPAAGGGDPALVELKAVDGAYPLYGRVASTPAEPLPALLGARDGRFGALAAPELFERMNLKPGAVLKLGRAEIVLTGVLDREPDALSDGFNFAPRLLVDRAAIEATGLLQPGSLYEYDYGVRLAQPVHSKDLTEAANARFPSAGWNIRTSDRAAPSLQRNIERFSQFLTLVGLTALIVGGVGVANAVGAYLSAKRGVIATFKSLGAGGGFVVTVYLVQIMLLAGLGILAGLVLGAVAPFATAGLVSAFLPIAAEPGFYPGALLVAALFGLLTALAFALVPLGRTRDVPATALFRDISGGAARRPRLVYLGAAALLALAIAALALAMADDRKVAGIFLLATGIAFLILRGVAFVIERLAKAARPPRIVALRLALANIHRPGALTASVTLSLGLGLTLLVALATIDTDLRREIAGNLAERAPDFFFVDIRNDGIDAFRQRVAELAPGGTLEAAPMLRGRITRLNGIEAAKVKVPPEGAWVLRGDRGITYADAVPKNSRLTEGVWWPKDHAGEPLVSFAAEQAKQLGLKLGDTITVNVLGRDITARIANLRTVEWESLGINFVMVFSPNAFAGAPHAWLATLAIPDATPAVEKAVLNGVADSDPAVTTVRVRDALNAVNRLVEQLAIAIRAAAAVALVASVLVLSGALAAGNRRRIHDAVVLKTLGGTRRLLIASYCDEYLLLGLATAGFAIGAGALAAWYVVARIMALPFHFDWGIALATLLAALVLTVGIGLAGTWRVLGQKAAPVLREL